MKKMNSFSWINVIGYIASFLTIIQVVIYIVLLPGDSNGENLWQLVIYQSAIVACVISLCTLLARSQYKIYIANKQIYLFQDEKRKIEKEIELKNRIIETLSTNNHNITHEVRQIQYKLYKYFINELLVFNIKENDEDDVDFIDIFKKDETDNYELKDFLSFFTTNVKNSFDCLTGNTCSVYITIFDDKNKQLVHTYYRDPLSYTERTNIDLKYPVYDINLFTPFKYIMNKHTINTVFACDDCSNYSNFCDRNDNWNIYYNSCLTIPIRLRVNKKKNRHHIIGFLTIDNKEGGLDNEIAKDVARTYADILYMIICMFTINDSLIINENDNEQK